MLFSQKWEEVAVEVVESWCKDFGPACLLRLARCKSRKLLPFCDPHHIWFFAQGQEGSRVQIELLGTLH